MQQANSFSGSHALVLSGVQKWADAAPRSWSTGRAYSFLSCWPRTRSLQIRAKQIKELDSERNETLKASHRGQTSEGLATDEKPARVIVYITSPRPTVWRSGAIPSSGTEDAAGKLVLWLACSWCLDARFLAPAATRACDPESEFPCRSCAPRTQGGVLPRSSRSVDRS